MAWAMAYAFKHAGIKVCVSGRSPEKVKMFAAKLDIPFLLSLEDETAPDDLVILAVKDDALPMLNKSLRLPGRWVCHCAGSVDLSEIQNIAERTGVFYPIQRVSLFSVPDFSHAPICIEAADSELLMVLKQLGAKLSDHVLELNSEKRRMAHLAAIFVSNFPNFMMMMGKEILVQNQLPETLLDELARNTFDGCVPSNAEARQTGPARRADLKIIGNHLHLLENNPFLEQVYRLLSFEIMKRFHADL
jgi:predicted short-subunit dehydrogenase-like oxidoreductase (DUF2520 family)